MNGKAKRVAILGAGASGLPAIKVCLESDLEPVCFEKTEDIGGLWNFRQNVENGIGSVMKSTIINTSKELMSYSDFPIPKEYPNFMHNTKVLQYFRLYAEKFDLVKHIKFQTEVTKVTPAEDFKDSGRWILNILDHKTKTTTTETFDAVMLCTGHHAYRHMAHFEGEENFKGIRLHSHEYRDHKGYDGKRVIVVGIGNSGGDIAVELGKFGSQVYLSTRRGSWVTHRIADNGLPTDYLFIRRFLFDVKAKVPRAITNWMVERSLNKRFDHSLYGLKPKHRFDAQHVTINDELPNRVASGTVILKPNIRRITETDVEFEDGTVEKNIDVIIYATGYTFGFPFMDHKAFEVQKNVVNLYKYVFAPDIQPATAAVIGCFQPLGAIMPVSELQCRWAVQVFKNEVKLPSSSEMWEDIRFKRSEMSKRYVESSRHTIQIEYVPFTQELAELARCKVDLGKLWKQDPLLAYKIYFGPATPYEFRLEGPGSWHGARDAILSTPDRVKYAFQTRKVEDSESSLKFWIILVVILAILFKLFF